MIIKIPSFAILISLGSLMFFSSCKKDDPTETVSVVPQTLDKNITTPTVLEKVTPDGQIDYIVTQDIAISSDLVIKPGVIIAFKQGTGFTVNTDGSLDATGTASENIVLKGEQDTPGYWDGIVIKTDDIDNKLTYASLLNAGTTAGRGAVWIFEDARLKMQHSTIKKSGAYGIYMDGANIKLDNFESNIITESANAPIFGLIQSFSLFDMTSDFTGNAKDYIDVNSLVGTVGKTINGTHIWKKINVPYRFPSHKVDVAGSVEVQPGASFIGQPNGGLRIVSGGSLKAIGTVTDSIFFSGEQNTAGYWPGFQFNSDDSDNEFQFVKIEDGGGTNSFVIPVSKANIEVYQGAFKISNSTIKNSEGAGIRVRSGATLTEMDNVFVNNAGGDILLE